MNNQIKSKTRLAFIQIIFQHISNKNDIFEIYEDFNSNYKSTYIQNFNSKKKIKFEFNSNFLKKLTNYYYDYINLNKVFEKINKSIDFNRSFEKWDLINQSILLATLSELNYIDNAQFKIAFNDYLNVSKFFINKQDINIINAVVDNVINEKKI